MLKPLFFIFNQPESVLIKNQNNLELKKLKIQIILKNSTCNSLQSQENIV